MKQHHSTEFLGESLHKMYRDSETRPGFGNQAWIRKLQQIWKLELDSETTRFGNSPGFANSTEAWIWKLAWIWNWKLAPWIWKLRERLDLETAMDSEIGWTPGLGDLPGFGNSRGRGFVNSLD